MRYPHHFYDHIRANLFSGSLKQAQVDGINAVLTAISPFSLPEQAYMLATVYHETARTMQPVEEYGKGAKYDYGRWRVNSKNERYCPKDGRRQEMYTHSEYPHLFYGRGYVQLTWYNNYLKAGEKLHQAGILDSPNALIEQPDLACDAAIAAQIICQGMKEGWFTGKKLSDYFSEPSLSGSGKTIEIKDYHNARRIINGTDKAAAIAAYAQTFETALIRGQ